MFHSFHEKRPNRSDFPPFLGEIITHELVSLTFSSPMEGRPSSLSLCEKVHSVKESRCREAQTRQEKSARLKILKRHCGEKHSRSGEEVEEDSVVTTLRSQSANHRRRSKDLWQLFLPYPI
jgi:hypothetical protein